MNLFGWLTPKNVSISFKPRVVSVTTKQSIATAWKSVEEALKTKTPSMLRQALITSDKCLDNALRDIVDAETMGERLKKAKKSFSPRTYDNIWRAHKIRNSMVHETDFEPSYVTLVSAIEDLQKGLREIGVSTR